MTVSKCEDGKVTEGSDILGRYVENVVLLGLWLEDPSSVSSVVPGYFGSLV